MNSPPSIDVLGEDLLLYIFDLNTHTSETEDGCGDRSTQSVSALDIVRHTSQVCHSWREFILQAPSIWGKVIDLEVLDKTSDMGFDEVLERTGEAHLDIYGPVGDTARSAVRFTSLVSEHWHRVRRLDVTFLNKGYNPHIDSDVFDVFWKRPAPNLEKFIVQGYIDRYIRDFPGKSGMADKRDNWLFFSGSAPSLRRIHCLHDFRFDHRASWLSRLVGLTVTRTFRTVEALNAIKQCSTRLESLVVDRTIDDEEAYDWAEKIHLPNLRYFSITNNVPGSLVYLSNLKTRSNCGLVLAVWPENMSQIKVGTLQNLSAEILPYAQNFFRIHRPTHLKIYVGFLVLSALCENIRKSRQYFGQPEFSVEFRTWDIRFNIDFGPVSSIWDAILHPLSLAAPETVYDLTVNVTYSEWNMNTASLLPLLQSLTSVKKMSATPFVFHVLNKVAGRPDTDDWLPGLVEVGLLPSHGEDTTAPDALQSVLQFLSHRLKAGKPMCILDLSSHSKKHELSFDGQGILQLKV